MKRLIVFLLIIAALIAFGCGSPSSTKPSFYDSNVSCSVHILAANNSELSFAVNIYGEKSSEACISTTQNVNKDTETTGWTATVANVSETAPVLCTYGTVGIKFEVVPLGSDQSVAEQFCGMVGE